MKIKSPGKINLFLDVHGPRGDGFHELSSLVAFLDLYDELEVELDEDASFCEIESTRGDVPVDADNLVYQAWSLFQKETGIQVGLKCRLFKKIPPGSGLGAGSGNAMRVLTFLNDRYGQPLSRDRLISIGAEIGSDCPMFIDLEPKIMRGRGENLEYLSSELQAKVRGIQLLVFRPEFGIPTPWAFRYFKKNPNKFTSKIQSESRIQDWKGGEVSTTDLLHNTLEAAAFSKYLSLKLLVDKLRKKYNFPTLLAGSGSTAFSIFQNEHEKEIIQTEVESYYGQHALCLEAKIV